MLVGTTINTLTTEYTYDDFGEMVGYQASNGSEELFSSTYTRDKLGRIETKTETILGTTTSRAYVYDQTGRLEQVKEGETVLEEYTYDTNGNRTSVTKNGKTITATYDAQDRMMTYGDATFTYTDNGELATKTESEGTTVYNYDLMGNLTYVQLPDGTEIEYIIDGQNRRIGKKINGTFVQGFIYHDQINLVAEFDGDGNVASRFIYLNMGHIPAYMIKNGAIYQIISDHLGSPRLVVDVDTGYVAQRRDFDTWGNVVLDTNPGLLPFGFAGGIEDNLTVLVRFGVRDYDLNVGRWISKDPYSFIDGFNLFQYVENDPINKIDPEGKFFFLLVAPAAYTGAMALADLTIATAMTIAMQSAMSSDDDNWRDFVDYDNWDFGKECFYPAPQDPNEEEKQRVKEKCFDECQHVMGQNRCDQGYPYTNCMKDCMARSGFTYP